jgi:polysaccharide export outer membrane protein
VLEAGGVTEFAASSKTLIYRKGSEPLKVRLDRILKAGDMTTNYELKPGDIITVPERIF